MTVPPRSVQRPLTLVEGESVRVADFTDAESRQVLATAANALARELGREAARQYFTELISRRNSST